MNIQVSIGQVKRDISDLVNRVAYRGERIILTSRGRPKAVLINLEDYANLQRYEIDLPSREVWLANAQALAERIRQRRSGQQIDVQSLLDENRNDLEGRDAR